MAIFLKQKCEARSDGILMSVFDSFRMLFYRPLEFCELYINIKRLFDYVKAIFGCIAFCLCAGMHYYQINPIIAWIIIIYLFKCNGMNLTLVISVQ